MTNKGGGVAQPISGTGGGSGGVTQVAAIRGGAGGARARGRDRMIGVFGWRESELAAIAILDAYWMDPMTAIVDVKIFDGDTDALRGFVELKANGWINQDGTLTAAFWERVHGR